MMQMIRKFFEAPRVQDSVHLVGGQQSEGRGIRNPDGSPVTVEQIMASFDVDEDAARKIAARRSR